MSKKNATAVTILSTADFDNPIWTNKQHLAVGLAKTNKIFYINSLGLRSPRLNKTDVSRIVRRLRRASLASSETSKGSSAPPSVHVLSPRVLPFHGIPLVQHINSRLISRFVLKNIPSHQRQVLWTFSPMTYGIERFFKATIYHSVDLLHTFAHTPSKQILDAEKTLASRANYIVASSKGVRDHVLKHTGRQSILWENVADTELYSSNIKQSPKNRAIFSGNLTPTKLDFDLLFALAESGVSLAIAGPVAIDGTAPAVKVQRLLAYSNVEYLGVLAPIDLAREVADSKVGLVPYLVNDHTAGIFPMKVYEYLSAGLEVICTPLNSLLESELPKGISVVGKETFLAKTSEALETYNFMDALDRSRRATPYSWTNRISAASTLIDNVSAETTMPVADER